MADDIWFEGPEYLLAAALVGFAVLGTMLYVQANPAAPWQMEAMYSSVFSVAASNDVSANTTLELPVEDAQYLNRQYRELNTRQGDGVGEAGFCINLVGDRMSVQRAGTIEASESSVTLNLANCLGTVDGIIHYHPPNSRPVLSGPDTSVHEEHNDKRALLDASFSLSCVQAGLMTTTEGERTRALRCYTEPESGYIGDDFPEIRVVIGA